VGERIDRDIRANGCNIYLTLQTASLQWNSTLFIMF
jgi:hypothetical protein